MKRKLKPTMTKRMIPMPIHPQAEEALTVTRISMVLSYLSPIAMTPTE